MAKRSAAATKSLIQKLRDRARRLERGLEVEEGAPPKRATPQVAVVDAAPAVESLPVEAAPDAKSSGPRPLGAAARAVSAIQLHRRDVIMARLTASDRALHLNDFDDLASVWGTPAAVPIALGDLVEAGRVIRVGRGLYTTPGRVA